MHFAYGAQLPGGDLADRFGFANNVGLNAEFIGANNLIFGLGGNMQFGTRVKEDPLAIIRTPEGSIIGNDLTLATVSLRQRGWNYGLHIGKLFPFSKKRSGLRVVLGGGYWIHRIRIQDDTQNVAQITGDYIKGYDRLSAGPAMYQQIGYQHVSSSRRGDFQIGFEFNQGFTSSKRDWDFSLRRKLDEKRVDLSFGIRLAWTLPFLFTASEQIFY